MNDLEQQLSIDALQHNDLNEFSRLVDAFSGPLYRLALKMLGNPQDAEDVLQNTFIKAMQNLENFEGRSSLSTWLYRIAVNEALMLLRKQKPEISLADTLPEDDQDTDYFPTEFTDWCCLPEEEFLNAESRQALEVAIRRLPETLRVVFLLRDIEGLSIQETSEALELTETAVKTRLLRARLRLREILSVFYSERIAKRKI
jgi:RNA polymerase sigma-70 factor (ECF subfamily)